jgi:hypothetical protein
MFGGSLVTATGIVTLNPIIAAAGLGIAASGRAIHLAKMPEEERANRAEREGTEDICLLKSHR